ncbi:HD domain-containing protein [Sporofaciens sp. SGI.106]|uniref:HD domain-containing protein n=1 Tax=Sporofaciens sp. SGI.106 TaxID=3420568 RepID=UPI003D06371B
MTPEKLLEILSKAAELKIATRHCYTSENRRESVADHSWRMALMAMLLSGEAEFQKVDMDRVIRMSLIHDLGEAFTGDIPTFEKTQEDAEKEETLLQEWIGSFPSPQKEEWVNLLREMEEMNTLEAKTYKALDKLEAVISHNESDIATWLPLEYELQFTYGKENVEFSEYLKELSKCIDKWTKEKIS